MAVGQWQVSDSWDTTNQYIKYRVACLENSTSTANNTSNVRITMNIWRTNTGYTTYGSGTAYVTINGTQYTQAITSSQPITYNDTTSNFFDKTLDIPHNTDGSKTLTVSAYVTHDRFSSSSHSYNFGLTKIPRQTSITKFTIAKRNETSLTFNWQTADTVDYVWYSTNNGTNWTGVDVTDGTSGSFVVSNLSPGTTYTNCKIRVRRKDSQMTTDSSPVSATTNTAPTQIVTSKTETSLTVQWNLDDTANHIWYSKDNGSNWTDVGNVSAKTGTFTITGLSAYTQYPIKTRVRRNLTNTTYDTAVINDDKSKTFDYPHVTGVGSSTLTIGNSQTLTLYNPIPRSVTVKMYQNNTSGTQLFSGTTNKTSYTFTPTSTTLYASIPSSQEGNCVYSVIYSSITKTTGTYKYKVNASQCAPSFSNFEYKDIASNDLITAIGNNQILVQGVSNVNLVISSANKMTTNPDYGASPSKYQAVFGNLSKVKDYSSSAIDENLGVITSSGNQTFKVTAYDSRNSSKDASKSINVIAYSNPVVNVSLQRTNNFEAETKLKVTGQFTKVTVNNEDKNLIKTVKYRQKESTSSTWGSWNPMTIQGQGSGNYQTTEVTLTLDNTKQFDFQVEVTDRAKAVTVSRTVSIGQPLMFLHTKGYLELNGNTENSDVYYKAERTDTGTAIGFGVGSGGTNHGLWSFGMSRWLIYGDGSFTILPRNVVVLGAAGDKPLRVRGIVGTDGGTANGELHLGYGSDYPTKFGKTAQTVIDANGTIKIPKAGDAGRGITNSDGVSIIRDHNNKNVTVDATGDTLFLGYQDTKAINILNGKDIISSDGTFTFPRGIGINFGSGTMKGNATYGDLSINNTGGYTYLAVNGTNILSVRSNGLYGKSGYPYYCGRDLYNNASGTNGTVTLAETAANFTFIEIFYRINDHTAQSVKVSTNAQMSRISCISGYKLSDTGAQIHLTTVGISGTSLTHWRNGGINLYNGTTNETYIGNELKINRVVGWRTT